MTRFPYAPVLTALVLSACSIRIPDATYVCNETEACPNGFVCSEGLCRRQALEVDASTCVAETCNGLDDDCDGFVDDGVTTVSTPAPIAPTSDGNWMRLVPLSGGGYLTLVAIDGASAGAYDIFATSFDSTGVVVAGPTDIADSNSAHFEATRFGPNFYVARMSGTNNDLVLDQFDVASFARVGTENTIVVAPYDRDSVDLVANATAGGDRIVVAFRADNSIRVANVNVPSLTDGNEYTVHTETIDDPTYGFVRLVVAPCSKGMYLAGFRENVEPEIRVHALTFDGVVDTEAPPLEISADSPNEVIGMARPLLIGGSCSASPSEIVVGWTEADEPVGGLPTFSREHVDRFAITRSSQAPTQTFARVGRWTLEPEAIILPQFIFSMLEPVALARLTDGRFVAALSTISYDQSTGSFEVYELMPDGTSFHHPTNLAPIAVAQIELATTDGTLGGLRIGGSVFTDDRAAATFSVACAP